MRILLLVPDLPVNTNQITGGVHSAVMNLLHGFRPTHHEVRVISFHKGLASTEIFKFSPNIEIHFENEGKWGFHALNYFFNGNKIIQKHLTSFQPDLVHFQVGNSFLLTGTKIPKSIPKVLTVHSVAFVDAKFKKKWTDKLKWYFNGIIHSVLQPANLILLSDKYFKDYDLSKLKNYSVIPNALRQDFFDIPYKMNTENKLVFVGVVNHRRNLLYLLHVLSELKKAGKIFTLDVLGGFIHDDYRSQIENYIIEQELTEQVILHGWSNQIKVLEYLAKSDILVMSSTLETLPMVIAEAKAAGKVVVSSDVGGIPDMITHEADGFLYNLSNPEALFNILAHLYNNHQEIDRIAQQARKKASDTCQSAVVCEKTVVFYSACLNNK